MVGSVSIVLKFILKESPIYIIRMSGLLSICRMKRLVIETLGETRLENNSEQTKQLKESLLDVTVQINP